MKLKHIAAAAVMVVSGSAFAVGPGPLGVLSSPVAVGNFLSQSVFSDLYTFTLAGPSTVYGDIDPLGPLAAPGSTFVVSIGNSSYFDTTPGDGFSFTGLNAGSYTLSLFGVAAANPLAYGGFVAATPVPEPETYALMLAGLGVVCLMASRRKQS